LRDRWRADARVLEVGSGSGGVTEWLDHPVVGVDTAFERTAERSTARLEQRIGRANALPVESERFDFVLSLDMLEHLPEDERSMALQEMVRALVPGGRMVMTFPADATAERLDRWLNCSFQALTGQEHPWVREHLEAGLPRRGEIRAEAQLVAGPEAIVELRPHFAPGAFRLVHGLYGVRRWYRFSRPLGLHSDVAVGVLIRLLRGREPRGEAYRAIFVIDKPAV